VRERLEYKHGVAQENGFLLGNGARQPLGIYVASDDGISTSRDVSTGNTESSVTFDGLIEAQYTLLPGYWANARWNFHRLTLKQIAKLKDGEGQYIWRPAVAAGQPATILGFPYDISEYVPHTYTTGLYVGCFADFSYYHIADSLAMTVQVLLELYAEANQNGYIGRLECDGMPILEEAFVRVTLA
jgi:HK97 family phage major capsid protein